MGRSAGKPCGLPTSWSLSAHQYESADAGGRFSIARFINTRILVGITSWGDAMCVVTGFDYRVDIPDTLDFIDDVIANHLP